MGNRRPKPHRQRKPFKRKLYGGGKFSFKGGRGKAPKPNPGSLGQLLYSLVKGNR